MGGLRKYMPITWITFLIGSLSLIGFPGFAGFFSKDAIILAVEQSDLPGSGIAYFGVLTGVFVTALYSFRLYFLVFHGTERMDEHTREHLHETPWVVTLPLVLLAIPSVIVGWMYVDTALSGEHFKDAIFVAKGHDVLGPLQETFNNPAGMVLHSLRTLPFWFAMAGVGLAYYLYLLRPDLPSKIAKQFHVIYWALDKKYGFDQFNEAFFAGGARNLGSVFWRVGDVKLIDGLMVNGSARAIGWFSGIVRRVQSGFLYDYAFAIIIGLLVFLLVFVHRLFG